MAQVSGSITLETGHLEYMVAKDVAEALAPIFSRIAPILERIEAAATGETAGGNIPPQALGSREAVRVVSGHLPAGVGSVACPVPDDVANHLVRRLAESGYLIVKVAQ
jgi:hypothetical protein